MNTDVIVLGVRPYNFEDERTGKQISGASVYVLPLENDDVEVSGLIPAKYTLTMEQFKEIANVSFPARAKMSMTFNLSTKKLRFDRFSNFEPLTLS